MDLCRHVYRCFARAVGHTDNICPRDPFEFYIMDVSDVIIRHFINFVNGGAVINRWEWTNFTIASGILHSTSAHSVFSFVNLCSSCHGYCSISCAIRFSLLVDSAFLIASVSRLVIVALDISLLLCCLTASVQISLFSTTGMVRSWATRQSALGDPVRPGLVYSGLYTKI